MSDSDSDWTPGSSPLALKGDHHVPKFKPHEVEIALEMALQGGGIAGCSGKSMYGDAFVCLNDYLKGRVQKVSGMFLYYADPVIDPESLDPTRLAAAKALHTHRLEILDPKMEQLGKRGAALKIRVNWRLEDDKCVGNEKYFIYKEEEEQQHKKNNEPGHVTEFLPHVINSAARADAFKFMSVFIYYDGGLKFVPDPAIVAAKAAANTNPEVRIMFLIVTKNDAHALKGAPKSESRITRDMREAGFSLDKRVPRIGAGNLEDDVALFFMREGKGYKKSKKSEMIMIFDPSGGDGNALYLTGDVLLRVVNEKATAH